MLAEDVSALWRSLAILAAVIAVTAWFSDLFYFPDEHYQVLEFMSYKLGTTSRSALPWEYAAQIRPWLQPALYYAIARPLIAAGATDLFDVVFVLRLLTGLFSLIALAFFSRALLPTIAGQAERRYFIRYLPLFGFLPYLFVRTASETFAAAFFALGVTATLGPRTATRLALAGLFCGLAFESRYSAALLGLGLFAWLAVVARSRPAALASFAGGGFAALTLGIVADRWGYGRWTFPPLGYLQFNVTSGGAAHQFGREPIFAYLYLMPAQFFFAITLVLMVALAAMWLRNPRHALSWATLPFVIGHMLVSHKEARFLFPLAILATAFPVLGFSPVPRRGRDLFLRVWRWRQSWTAGAVTALSLIFMAYLMVYPFGIRPHMPMAKYLYRHFTGDFYSFTPPFESYPMYRSHPFQAVRLAGPMQLQPLLDKGAVAVMAETPVPPSLPPGVHATLLYSEFPLAKYGYGQAGADYIAGWTAFAARYRWLKLLSLHWYTLYRVERSATIRS